MPADAAKRWQNLNAANMGPFVVRRYARWVLVSHSDGAPQGVHPGVHSTEGIPVNPCNGGRKMQKCARKARKIGRSVENDGEITGTEQGPNREIPARYGYSSLPVKMM